jgi:hypothetical protein
MIPSANPEIMFDSWNKSADCAMENDVWTESCFPSLASDCPEHQFKGISIRTPSRYLKGEKRGGFDFTAPEGWMGFGLNVGGKIQERWHMVMQGDR